jgi:hypothetical protein
MKRRRKRTRRTRRRYPLEQQSIGISQRCGGQRFDVCSEVVEGNAKEVYRVPVFDPLVPPNV